MLFDGDTRLRVNFDHALIPVAAAAQLAYRTKLAAMGGDKRNANIQH